MALKITITKGDVGKIAIISNLSQFLKDLDQRVLEDQNPIVRNSL